MDEQDGGTAMLGQAAQVVEQRLDGEDGVLVAAAENARQCVYDDQLGFERKAALDEVVDVFRLAQVVAAEGDEVEGQAVARGAAVEHSMDASPEAAEAGFFVDKNCGGLGDRAIQPRLTCGYGDGEIERSPSFERAGWANEEVEAGAGEDAFNAPLGLRRVGVGIVGPVVDAGFFFGVFDGFEEGVDLFDHLEMEVFGGFDEGLVAGTAAAGGDLVNGVGDVNPLDRQVGRERTLMVVLDEAGGEFGGRGIGNVWRCDRNPRVGKSKSEVRMQNAEVRSIPHPRG